MALAAALPVLGLVPSATAATAAPAAPGAPVAPSAGPVAAAPAAAVRPHLAATDDAGNPSGPEPTANGGGPLVNSGNGPVQTAPRIYVDYWGWTSDPAGVQPYLNRFYSSVGASPWLATLDQYGASSSPDMLAGTWSDPTPVPAVPTDAQLQAEAVSAAQHFGAGTSLNTQIIVATPTGHSTAGFGSSYCGYHGAVAALPSITYTDLPYMPDAAGSCGAGSANGAAGTLDGVSIVAGHEMAETITDPLINGWRDSAGAEIADKCAWVNIGNTNLSGNSFAMQPLWSNNSGGCAMGSGSWSNWQQHNAPTPGIAAGASPVVSSWGPRRLDLFVRGKDGAIWHQPYDTTGAGWYPWESMGGSFVSNPAAVSWDSSRLDLFGVGTDGNIWHRSWNNPGGWGNWTTDFAAPPPGLAAGATPTVTSWGTGRLDLFVRGKDNAIWHLDYSNGWSKWESLGAKIISDPAATSPDNGRIDLFGLGTNNNIWHKYWTPAAGWTSWSPDLPALPAGIAPGSSPAASLWQPNSGEIEVYVRGKDGAIWNSLYSNGSWGAWASQGGALAGNTAALSPGPNMIDLFATGTNGSLEERTWA
ncbi:hypothetical protein ACFZB9_00150 [Kitasatospora sp. NPDC008050]|uniref:hypothetical protein n=1 Tax=Kitasatospora sp. NPDC008050 TaxID=3364021 RepID=UPI0036E767B9